MARLVIGLNDLATVNPDLAAEWNFEKNGSLSPTKVTSGSGKKVWWKHGLPDGSIHEWQATIASRNAGRRCPYCSNQRVLVGYNDLASINRDVASQWDYELNKDLKPTDIISGSNQKAWWRCSKCKGSWRTTVASRLSGSGCPYCSNRMVLVGYNDLLTTHPAVAAEWNYERNGSLTPAQFTYGNDRRVWWRCSKCGHEWRTSIHNRTNGAFATGCPNCSLEYGTSFPEQALLFYIRKYVNPVAESRFKLVMSGYTEELDIWIPSMNIGIEYDGEFYHASRIAKDREKDRVAQLAGVRLIRIIEGRENKVEADRIYIDVHHGKKGNIENAITYVVGLLANRTIELNIDDDTSEIMSLYKRAIEQKSLLAKFPNLASEWDFGRNATLRPENVSFGSTRKVWWKCKFGHEWIASINSRTNTRLKSGCPYCSGKKDLARFNDLATALPSLSAEWDYVNNGPIKPTDVTRGSRKSIWWVCRKCGSSYKSSVANRAKGSGCPVCCGKQVVAGLNDLASTNPQLAAEWNYDKNGSLKPEEVTANSHETIWWLGKCGHEWQAKISNRNNGKGCPYCASRKVLTGFNELATIRPDIASEWNYVRNGDLKPTNVMPRSGKKVWWKCPTCGNEWQTAVHIRTSGHICPHCAHAG